MRFNINWPDEFTKCVESAAVFRTSFTNVDKFSPPVLPGAWPVLFNLVHRNCFQKAVSGFFQHFAQHWKSDFRKAMLCTLGKWRIVIISFKLGAPWWTGASSVKKLQCFEPSWPIWTSFCRLSFPVLDQCCSIWRLFEIAYRNMYQDFSKNLHSIEKVVFEEWCYTQSTSGHIFQTWGTLGSTGASSVKKLQCFEPSWPIWTSFCRLSFPVLDQCCSIWRLFEIAYRNMYQDFSKNLHSIEKVVFEEWCYTQSTSGHIFQTWGTLGSTGASSVKKLQCFEPSWPIWTSFCRLSFPVLDQCCSIWRLFEIAYRNMYQDFSKNLHNIEQVVFEEWCYTPWTSGHIFQTWGTLGSTGASSVKKLQCFEPFWPTWTSFCRLSYLVLDQSCAILKAFKTAYSYKTLYLDIFNIFTELKRWFLKSDVMHLGQSSHINQIGDILGRTDAKRRAKSNAFWDALSRKQAWDPRRTCKDVFEVFWDFLSIPSKSG